MHLIKVYLNLKEKGSLKRLAQRVSHRPLYHEFGLIVIVRNKSNESTVNLLSIFENMGLTINLAS